ncbi:outer membrane lipoprotein SlyB [Rhodanobacter sp. K2T2]|uniref:zeta toxin family protein n=1 Tax=Rhodanobacter sp. K2T2 TaxID=2723085 RepID=UPI0015CCA94C|nr:zeta toxin family protein [Rhodanobacter sp. K2T2]NYE27384.1 outer membrane lipoprotein SlyB [Rhodanobacter sp. K2T2]
MNASADQLDSETHARIFEEKIAPQSLLQKTSYEHPKAIILGGQPGSGKGGLARAADNELANTAVTIDPDALREYHPNLKEFQSTNPYTWSGRTHADASQWADELRNAAVAGKKNIIFDTTLSNGQWTSELIKDLQAKGYDVEVRAVAAHKLESEHGVDSRFSRALDQSGSGRYVPAGARDAIYDKVPASLDTIRAQTDAPIRLFTREGKELYDSRTDARLPGQVMNEAREARLSDPQITRDLNQRWKEQAQWHEKLPDTLAHNPKVAPGTAQRLLTERSALNVVEGVERNAAQAASLDYAVRIHPNVVKGVGIVGGAAMAYDAYQTAQQYQALSAKGNQFGADALLHQYEGRTAGGLIGGFAAGAAYGAVAGSESGPGALVTGAVGGVVGAFAGDKIATAYNEHQVNHQTGTNGVTYAYDKGQWTQTEHHLGLSSYDLPTIKSTTIHAPADQISTLDYQRTTAVTALALANPVTQDTKNITLDGTEWHASRGGWTKEVQQTTPGLPQADDFGRPITISEPADAKTAKQLDQLAANRQYNNAHYAESVSQAYVIDYYGKGWNKNGPLPEVVTQELKRPSETQITDPATGHTWTADGKGHFSREETTVGFDMPVTMTVKADGAELARVGKLQQEAMQSNAAYGSQLIADKYAQLQQTSMHQQAPVQPAPAATPDHAAVNPAASHTPPHVAEAPSAFFHEMSAKIDRFDKAMQAGDRTAVMKEVAHVYETPEWQASYGRARETAAKEQQQREHERAQNPRDPRDAGHPDHAMNQSIRKQVETLHERAGTYIGNQELDRLTASVANDARKQGMTRVDQVQFGGDKNQVIATQGGPHDMLSKHSVTNVQQAMQTPPEHAYQQMGQETQRQAQVQQNVQQQIAQSQQQGQSLGR